MSFYFPSSAFIFIRIHPSIYFSPIYEYIYPYFSWSTTYTPLPYFLLFVSVCFVFANFKKHSFHIYFSFYGVFTAVFS